MVGYDQSYLSALEIGQKGPPTSEFVERLISSLSLDEAEKQELVGALEASERKLTISTDAEEEVYLLLKDLRKQLPVLSTIQVRMMRDLLRLRDPELERHPITSRKRMKQEARM